MPHRHNFNHEVAEILIVPPSLTRSYRTTIRTLLECLKNTYGAQLDPFDTYSIQKDLLAQHLGEMRKTDVTVHVGKHARCHDESMTEAVERMQYSIEDAGNPGVFHFIEIDANVDISDAVAATVDSQDQKGVAYLVRDKAYWHQRLDSFWEKAPHVTLPSTGYTAYAQDLTLQMGGQHSAPNGAKLNFASDPGVGPHPACLWVDKVGDISLCPEDFEAAWQYLNDQNNSYYSGVTVYVIRYPDDPSRRYLETVHVPKGGTLPRGKVIMPCRRNFNAGDMSVVVDCLAEEVDDLEYSHPDYDDESDSYTTIQCDSNFSPLIQSLRPRSAPNLLCNFELTDANRTMVIGVLKKFFDTNSHYAFVHWSSEDFTPITAATWFNTEAVDRTWMFLPGENNPTDIIDCFGIDYSTDWIELENDVNYELDDCDPGDEGMVEAINRMDIVSQVEDLEEVRISKEIRTRVERLGEATRVAKKELVISTTELNVLTTQKSVNAESLHSAKVFLDRHSGPNSSQTARNLAMWQKLAFAKSYQLKAEQDGSVMDQELTRLGATRDSLKERVDKLHTQKLEFDQKLHDNQEALASAIELIQSETDPDYSLSHIFNNMGVVIQDMKISYTCPDSSTTTTVRVEDIPDSTDIFDPSARAWISYLKFSTTEPMDLDVFIDNELDSQITAGPFQYELTSSHPGCIDESKIRPAGKATILAHIKNDIDQGGYGEVRCHPHAGGMNFRSSFKFSDDTKADDLRTYYAKWNWICLGEASPALADAAERNSLEDMITIMLVWTKTIQGKDEWGNCYDNFPVVGQELARHEFYVKEDPLGVKYVTYIEDRKQGKISIIGGTVPSVAQLQNGGVIPVDTQRAIALPGGCGTNGVLETIVAKDLATKLRQGYVRATAYPQVNETASAL